METDYFILDKTSSSIIILSISLNKSRLDISPTSAPKKKPCCDSNRALLFSDRQKLAFVRGGNNKARSSAQRCKAFSLGCYPKRIKPNGVRFNPLSFHPQTPQGGLRLVT
jgi:hypothetical protein